MKSKISVIIPAYNAEQWLHRSVKSCLRQTLRPAEIIIVDDASHDNTYNTAQRLAEQYSEIRILKQQTNHGPAAARNLGVAASRCEFISFLDADDTWSATKLEKQFIAIKNQPQAGLVITALQECNPMGQKTRIIRHMLPATSYARVVASFMFEINMLTPTMFMPRYIFEKTDGFDESLRMGEDHFLFMQIAAQHEIIYLNEPLVDRWLVPTSYSRSITPESMKSHFQTFIDVSLQNFPFLHSYMPALTAKMYFQIGRRFQKQDDLINARRYFIKSFYIRHATKTAFAWLTTVMPNNWQTLFRDSPQRYWQFLQFQK